MTAADVVIVAAAVACVAGGILFALWRRRRGKGCCGGCSGGCSGCSRERTREKEEEEGK